MSKSYRAWQIAAVAFAMAVSIWAVAAHPLHDLGLAAFFAALILCASFLRIEADEASVAFEAPIVFGAIIIFHDPALALLAAFLGGSLHAIAKRPLRFDPFAAAAESSLAYGVVALLYTSAIPRLAPAMGKVSGYLFLLFGYVVATLLLASIRGPVDYRRMVMTQGKLLLLLSPVVGIEVMLNWPFATGSGYE